MSEWKQVLRKGGYEILLRVEGDGGASVYLTSGSRWECRVQSPPWWMFWRITIPEAIARASEEMDRRIEQDAIKREAEKDAADLADEIAKMYKEES